MKNSSLVLFFLISLVYAASVYAVPYTLDSQGLVRNATTGALLTGTHTVNMTFYKVSDDSVAFSDQQDLNLDNGIYNMHIGMDTSSYFEDNLYMRLKIDSDSQLAGVNLTSAPYALYCEMALNVNYSAAFNQTVWNIINNATYLDLSVVSLANASMKAFVDAQITNVTTNLGLANTSVKDYTDSKITNVTTNLGLANTSVKDYADANFNKWSWDASNHTLIDIVVDFNTSFNTTVWDIINNATYLDLSVVSLANASMKAFVDSQITNVTTNLGLANDSCTAYTDLANTSVKDYADANFNKWTWDTTNHTEIDIVVDYNTSFNTTVVKICSIYNDTDYYTGSDNISVSATGVISVNATNWDTNISDDLDLAKLDNVTIIRTYNGAWVVTAVGNWSQDKPFYYNKTNSYNKTAAYNKTETGTIVGLANTSVKDYTDNKITNVTTNLGLANTSLKDYTDSKITNVTTNIGLANTSVKDYVELANSSCSSYTDTANNSMREYGDKTFVNITGDTMTGPLNAPNVSASEYLKGQPLDGGIGSGIIWCNSINSNGNVNVTHIAGLNVSYPNCIARLVTTNNAVTYCNITNATVTVPDNQHSVYYVDATCNLQSTTMVVYLATDLSPGGITDIFNVYATDGEVEVVKGITVKNKETIQIRKEHLYTDHLRIESGMDLTDETFPELNMGNGYYFYIRTRVNAVAVNSTEDGMHIVYHNGTSTGWIHSNQTGINLTNCDNGSTTITCATNKLRRYVFYTIGVDSGTELHQLMPLTTDTTYNFLADCLNIESNPVAYTLPSQDDFVAVVHHIYCGLRDATAWTDGFIDIREGVVGGGAIPDTSVFLTKDMARKPEGHWDLDGYTFYNGVFNGTWNNSVNYYTIALLDANFSLYTKGPHIGNCSGANCDIGAGNLTGTIDNARITLVEDEIPDLTGGWSNLLNCTRIVGNGSDTDFCADTSTAGDFNKWTWDETNHTLIDIVVDYNTSFNTTVVKICSIYNDTDYYTGSDNISVSATGVISVNATNWDTNISDDLDLAKLDNVTIIRTYNGAWVVTAVGNWSQDKPFYYNKTNSYNKTWVYNKTETGTIVGLANDSCTAYTDLANTSVKDYADANFNKWSWDASNHTLIDIVVDYNTSFNTTVWDIINNATYLDLSVVSLANASMKAFVDAQITNVTTNLGLANDSCTDYTDLANTSVKDYADANFNKWSWDASNHTAIDKVIDYNTSFNTTVVKICSIYNDTSYYTGSDNITVSATGVISVNATFDTDTTYLNTSFDLSEIPTTDNINITSYNMTDVECFKFISGGMICTG